jgi:hypothetical protein
VATLNKNFRIKNGLVVEGSTATVNGQNILTETGSDQYILNLIGGETLVKSVDTNVFNVDNAGNLTINANTFDSYGSAAAAEAAANSYTDDEISAALTTAQGYANTAQSNAETFATNAINALDTDDIEEGSSNLYFTNQRALDATSAAYDAAGAASTAQSNAETFATNAINALDTDDIEEGVTNQYFTNQKALDATSAAYDAVGSATTAEDNAKAYADSLINDASTTTTNVWSAYKTSSEIGVAVSNLVDSAPALLDTLNELAAAIADNPNYATDMAANLAAKQNTLTAGTGITIADDEISVTANTYDAYGAAAAAQAAAETTASGDATTKANAAQAAAEATAQAALDDVLDATTAFTALNVNDEAKQFAASSTSLGSVVVTAYEWAKADYRSAKALVKIDNGTHNEISEILLTLDSLDNVSITEYAIVGTNGSRGTITADISGSNVRIRVNPVNDSTIKITGTLLK